MSAPKKEARLGGSDPGGDVVNPPGESVHSDLQMGEPVVDIGAVRAGGRGCDLFLDFELLADMGDVLVDRVEPPGKLCEARASGKLSRSRCVAWRARR